MFNPKENLLDQQLAVSGLEMHIDPFTAISAVASIAGGIMGSNQASKANKSAKKNYEEQKRAAEESARRTNEYNRKVFEADKENYENTRAYDWETTLRNYKYNTEIQDYNYAQTVGQYLGSVENTQQQLFYNEEAAKAAYESEQASLGDLLAEDAFARESFLVEQLQAQGMAQVRSVGTSGAKTIQSRMAEFGRNQAAMDASMEGAVAQTKRNLADIALGKFIDDQNVISSMMIKPERGPLIPKPVQAPRRIFVEPMEATAAYIAAPLMQNTFAPLVQGIGGAASAVQSWTSSYNR